MPRLDAGTCTHRGDRESNEDRAICAAAGHVCAVADGMGGARGGGVASRIAAEAVGLATDELIGHADLDDLIGCLADLCERTNQLIVQTARREPELLGMGTTLTLAVLSASSVSFAHVGDTRLYHWHDGDLEQLTVDHTSSQQKVARGLPPVAGPAATVERSTLTRCLGTVRRVRPDLGRRELLPRDRIMISSDGVHVPLGDERIRELLSPELPSVELARSLVEAARHAAGRPADNLTALVVKPAGDL